MTRAANAMHEQLPILFLKGYVRVLAFGLNELMKLSSSLAIGGYLLVGRTEQIMRAFLTRLIKEDKDLELVAAAKNGL